MPETARSVGSNNRMSCGHLVANGRLATVRWVDRTPVTWCSEKCEPEWART